ncbi:hypothetical protein [Paracoccus sp. SY]|uniref:hypothetical protein n=1 Tax=Paracoccus sp. SY TaxID=1330255 RepID=UPI0011AF6EC6|nr:hypothetical protein [Paracoccus sp. SY]
MSDGFLKLEGGPPLAGPVEQIGDLILLRTRSDMTKAEFAELHEGQLETGGMIERIALESTEISQDGRYSMDLMLRRLPPEA